jgi:pimeloyl-ACP methyl ester carboxylesterase
MAILKNILPRTMLRRPEATGWGAHLRSAAFTAAVNCSFSVAPRTTTGLLAARMCTPCRIERRKAIARGTGGAKLRTVIVDNTATAVYHWGDCQSQPYVLSSHGWDSSACWFGPWAAPLQEAGYALVAVDQPAHGRSEAGVATVVDFACTLFAIASRLGPPAGLLGHSLGGLAAALAMKEGFAASRAVLVAPTIGVEDVLGRRVEALGLRHPLRRRLLSHFEATSRASLDQLDLRSCAGHIGTAALLVCDETDAESDWRKARQAIRDWPDSRFLMTSGRGHRRILADPGVIKEGVAWLTGETMPHAPGACCGATVMQAEG